MLMPVRGIELIPSGELEGRPAVRVRVPAKVTSGFIVSEFTQAWRPGVRILWLEADQWGDPAVDVALAAFQSDHRTHEILVWCQRNIDASEWPSTPLWSVVDASTFMAVPCKTQQLAESMIRAPYIPRPTELVVRNPAEGNLTPGLLDQLTTNYDPERSAWIELGSPPARLMERAVGVACTATYGWGVRERA